MSIDRPPTPRNAAQYFSEHRNRISRDFARLVITHLGLSPTDRVLDLGCGPGILATMLSPYVGEVIAIESEPMMIEECRRRCGEASIGNVSLIESDLTEGVPEIAGTVRSVFVTEMSRPVPRWQSLLAELDGLVDPEGSVALVSPEVMTFRPAWWGELERLLARQLPGAPIGIRPGHHRSAFADALRRSAFSDVEELRLEYDVVERPSLRAALGTWYSTQWVLDRLGDRRSAFEAEVHDRLGWVDDLPVRTVRHRDVAVIGIRSTG